MGLTLRIAEEEAMRRVRGGVHARKKKNGDFGYPADHEVFVPPWPSYHVGIEDVLKATFSVVFSMQMRVASFFIGLAACGTRSMQEHLVLQQNCGRQNTQNFPWS
jgi:hypothetical protein